MACTCPETNFGPSWAFPAVSRRIRFTGRPFFPFRMALRLNGLGGWCPVSVGDSFGQCAGPRARNLPPEVLVYVGLVRRPCTYPPSHPCAALHESSPRSTTAARLAAKPFRIVGGKRNETETYRNLSGGGPKRYTVPIALSGTRCPRILRDGQRELLCTVGRLMPVI